MTINSKKEKAVAVVPEINPPLQLNPAYDPTASAETVAYYRYCPTTFVATDMMYVPGNEKAPDNSTRWVPPQCPPGTQAYFDGFGWVRCVAFNLITPKLLRAALTDVAKRELRKTLNEIKAGAADEETETYLQQYADAQSYIATGYASTFLKVLSETRDKPIETLARTIVRKADVYHTATAQALATYQNLVDKIDASEPTLTLELLHERRLVRV